MATIPPVGDIKKQDDRAVWVFGYGSLIWDSCMIEKEEARAGVLPDWHREWNWISKNRRHGAPTCSLEPGGYVRGIFFRLKPESAKANLEALQAREDTDPQKKHNVPEDGATTYFWPMGNNLPERFKGLDDDERATELARIAVETQQPGPDGVSAKDYIGRVNAFDPEDPKTARLARRVFRQSLTFGDRLRYSYLLRVPILVGLVLAALPVVSLFCWRELLGNLFVLGCPNIFWTTMAAVMLTWSILVVSRVVLLNGENRFGVRQGMTKDVVTLGTLLSVEVLYLPMIGGVVFSNGQMGNWQIATERALMALAGILAAHVLGFFALLASVWVSQRYGTSADKRYPVPPGFMRSWLRWAYNYDNWPKWWQNKKGKLADVCKELPPAIRDGYFDPYTGLLYPGHWLCVMMFGFTLALYLFIWVFGRQIGVPAICYVILLLILLSWILSGFAFFLDRYRIPLSFLGLIVILAGGLAPQADHYYSVKVGSVPRTVTPGEVLAAAARLGPDADHPRGRVVLVATAGGGIQAAAWTAQVLTGLQGELQRRFPDDRVSFADSIALISSVSGGAVGTLFFANRYTDSPGHSGFAASGSALSSIVEMAEKPSLNEIGWALAYADFWRVFFPYIKSEHERLVDRGWALEEGWRNSGDVQAGLSEWRAGVKEGWRPALIFNSTIVETGEPLLLTTTDIQPGGPANEPNWRTLSDMFPNCRNCDIPVVTAVRLAASFPFVTPASRPISQGLPYHVVDGGYYDNYGVYSSEMRRMSCALFQGLSGGIIALRERARQF
jgi:hypothetical protein